MTLVIIKQPFLRNSVVVLKYLKAAAYFKDLMNRRRSAAAISGWYRQAIRRRQIGKMNAAAVVIQVGEVPCSLWKVGMRNVVLVLTSTLSGYAKRALSLCSVGFFGCVTQK